ncbi:MAG: hypothetical protein BroJett030_30470 [Alphaproteobacteria bacterium]|nr:MAG: hypothetical protein BroJett030_30470 [Alphaproteobacteria bacterium]
MALGGCGTTYGTGVSQEEQTVKDMYNLFALSPPRKNIDYSPRPDLIVPENTAALPEPLDESVTTSNPEWPESPEERIARVRAEAGEIDPRTGDYAPQELRRRKEGIAIETSNHKGDFRPGKTDRDGNPILYMGDDEARKKVQQAKAGTTYNCASRRYLTEPPPEYCSGADTAPQGAEAFTEAELAAREDEKKKRETGFKEPKPFSSRD